jgi:hypothetical protein
VPAPRSFDYAVLRIVPRVERGEAVNAGVVLFSSECDTLVAAVHWDAARVRALHPDADLDAIARHLEVVPRIAAGATDAGPIARLSTRERFHWLVAPRSTVLQPGPVHSGLSEDPTAELERLMDALVR